jgi:hypothetical protein
MENNPNPFDLLLQHFRAMVREELRAAGLTSGNGGHQNP